MDILVHFVRHVVVDDVLHQGNVQSSPGHGGSHQDGKLPGGEVGQSLLPLSLGSVPVDAGGGVALAREVGGQVVGGGLFLQRNKFDQWNNEMREDGLTPTKIMVLSVGSLLSSARISSSVSRLLLDSTSRKMSSTSLQMAPTIPTVTKR